jgi:hypothetical protein
MNLVVVGFEIVFIDGPYLSILAVICFPIHSMHKIKNISCNDYLHYFQVEL